jgi:antitoxin ParD1/3/4
MNINFPPADEKFIKSQVAAGYYTNATEVVRDAVRRARKQIDEEYEARLARLNAALQRGRDDADAGRTVEYTKDYMKKTLPRIRKLAAKGITYDPEVIGPEGQEPWA